MPHRWTDEPAARLANMIDLTCAPRWDDGNPVFAMLHHRPGDTDDIHFLSRPLDVSIPEMVSGVARDDECVAMAISTVFPAGHQSTVAARVTVAVCDRWTSAVYRYRNGFVRRSDIVGAELRAQMYSLWLMRVRFELGRPASPAA